MIILEMYTSVVQDKIPDLTPFFENRNSTMNVNFVVPTSKEFEDKKIRSYVPVKEIDSYNI